MGMYNRSCCLYYLTARKEEVNLFVDEPYVDKRVPRKGTSVGTRAGIRGKREMDPCQMALAPRARLNPLSQHAFTQHNIIPQKYILHVLAINAVTE